MKTKNKLLLSVLLLFVSIAVYWQIDYEIAISETKKSCINVRNKKRVRYTPVIIYKARLLFRDGELKTDRLIYNAAFRECTNMQDYGYHLEYMVHVYFTAQERDNLVQKYMAE